MRLSFVVPIYNRESSLRECIESLLKIDSKDVEFLLIDDGSEDGSLSICKFYARADSRIQVIHQENSGVSSARNHGIRLSKGDYIMFVDSDDQVIAETIDSFLKEHVLDSDLYCFDYYVNNVENYHNRDLHESPDYGLLYSFLYQDNNAVWNNIYRTALIKDNHILFDTSMKMGEDLLFNIAFIQVMGKWEYISRPVYIYQDNTVGSAIHTYKFSYIKNYIKMFEKLYPYYQKTKFKEFIDWPVYLNGIFINAFSTEENPEETVFDELEQSSLFYELSNISIAGIRMKFKLFCVKHKFYRKPLMVKVVRKIFY